MTMMSRRTMLRGLGTAIALPALDLMRPSTATANSSQQAPIRMAFMFVPNGINMDHWRPNHEGSLGELPATLKPLHGLQNKFSVLSGLTQQKAFANGDGPGDHARAAAAWLTGAQPRKTQGSDIYAGVSADQIAAVRLKAVTKFASLELGCERGGMNGDCDSGYSCAYSSSISWRAPGTPLAKEINPRLVFERLFGSGDGAEDAEARARRNHYQQSILDYAMKDAAALRGRLGARDQYKLDEYLQGVRETEIRLVRFENANKSITDAKRPLGIPQDFGAHLRLMGDMLVMAFQTDLTRVSTFMFANEGSNRSYPMVGVSEGHHEISHHGKDPQKLDAKRRIDTFHVSQLAYILNRMNAVQDGDGGTLLDNCMIVFGGGISDGDQHNHDDLPILFAGSAGGAISTGKHINYRNGTPLNNLYLAMLEKAGLPVETLGDSSGVLAPLF